MPAKKKAEAKARREPNPYLQIEGRIPMQHPARHETMYGTNRSRSASPANHRDWDPRTDAPRAQLRRERDYGDMRREYVGGQGRPSRSAQRGRGAQNNGDQRGPPPHPWMEGDDEYEYQGRQGDSGGFVPSFAGRGVYDALSQPGMNDPHYQFNPFSEMNHGQPTNNSGDMHHLRLQAPRPQIARPGRAVREKRGLRRAAAKDLARGLQKSIEVDDADEDADWEADDTVLVSESQSRQTLSVDTNGELQPRKVLLPVKYEEFLNYACGRFDAKDHTELVIGLVGKRFKIHEKLGDVLLNFAIEKFGRQNEEGDPKQLMIVEKSELVQVKTDLVRKEERIAELEAQVLDLEDEIQGFTEDDY